MIFKSGTALVEGRCGQLFQAWLGGAGAGGEGEVEPGLREVVMKVALASCPQHQALDTLLALLDTPQERNRSGRPK